MKGLKKLAVLLLCLCFVFALIACGDTDNGNNGNTDGDNDYDGTGYKVVFDCDEHVSVRVYPTQDMSGNGVNTVETYSRDGSTGAYLEDGTGQVNFVLVFDNGYELNSIGATPNDYYNDIKGYADTQKENGYRITKIAGNIIVKVVSKQTGQAENTTGIPKVTFNCDSHVKVTVYKTQDLTSGGTTNATTAYARGSDTGALSTDGSGQVNFVLVFDNGYELGSILGTPGANYNNLKGATSTGDENAFRMTKITGDVTVSITSKAVGEEEDLTNAYKVTFNCGDHVKVMVYKTQDLTSGGEQATIAYARSSATGLIDVTGEGQVNFVIVFDSGYVLNTITATPDENYKNLKANVDDTVANSYRITKINGAITVNITAKQG